MTQTPPADSATAGAATAHAAVAQGCAALAAGEVARARAWFDRADRLAPEDVTLRLLRASAWLDHDLDAAGALIDAVLRERPGLAEARILSLIHATRSGDRAGAVRGLQHLLATQALPQGSDVAGLADVIVARAGAAGWVALEADGVCVVSSVRPDAALSLSLDGSPLRLETDDGGAPRRCRLPEAWHSARQLQASSDGVALIGSPIDLTAILRIEGCVAVAEDGGLSGWAWHPAAPQLAARLCLSVHDLATGVTTVLRITAGQTGLAPETAPPGAHRSGFRVPRALLPRLAEIRVRGTDGRELAGSPLTLGRAQQASRLAAARIARLHPLRPGVPACGEDCDSWLPLDAGLLAPAAWRPAGRAAAPKRVRLDIVIPVFRGAAQFTACLASLRGQVPRGGRIVVVDDGSEDQLLVACIAAAAAAGTVTLLRHAENQGFPGAVRTGLRHALAQGARDVLLLNPDTVLPPRAIARLRRAAYAGGDIGSVTPMTNDGTIVSYPAPDHPAPPQDGAALRRLDDDFAAANPDVVVDLPTGVGFCLLLRHDCLLEVGGFRCDVFAQGYGEENDWCLRAGHLGWRHVAAADVFVAHAGGTSFGTLKSHLVARNLALLNRLHPGYDRLIADFRARDPLRAVRHAVDRLRFQAGRRPQGAVVLISHALGGGVARHVEGRIASLRAQGLRPILLQPGADGCCRVTAEPDAPEVVFHLPEDDSALVGMLADERPVHVELHHFVGYGQDIAGLAQALGVPCDIHVHDYATWCPRVTLLGDGDRYCGEPAAVQACVDCVARHGSRLQDPIGVAALRRRSAGWFAAARQVIVPSRDTAARIARHFPGLPVVVRPWQDDAALAPPPPGAAVASARRLRVLVPGAIGLDKGFAVLRACALDAAARDLPLEFVVVGFSMDDAALLETGRVFVTGRFAEAEGAALVAAQGADLGLLPSVWPETWCYALSLLWQAGLPAVVFDLGAQAERVRASGAGVVLPLGLPPARVNDLLLAAACPQPVRSRTK